MTNGRCKVGFWSVPLPLGTCHEYGNTSDSNPPSSSLDFKTKDNGKEKVIV